MYENRMLTQHNVPAMIRAFLIYMAVSLPVICFVGYCDLVLRNERGFSFKVSSSGLCGLTWGYSGEMSQLSV